MSVRNTLRQVGKALPQLYHRLKLASKGCMDPILHLTIKRIISLKRAAPEEICNTSPPVLDQSQAITTETETGKSYIEWPAHTHTDTWELGFCL